jgi:hypothetical protein
VIGSLYKITTDSEGESKITFCIPLSELANVVRLNALIQRELNIEITENTVDSKTKSEDK